MIKGSYVEPHYHELPQQWEMFSILEGAVSIFNSEGVLCKDVMLGLEYGCVSVELEPGVIYSIECISDRAFLMEVKEGPFDSRFAKVLVGL
jgi:cupin fold WbuC family metalloprotein